MVEVTRHFSATTYVVHNGKVLLHLHKKLNKWLPVGGHIDRDELPHEAAVREVLEETGLNVKLLVGRDLLKTDNASELAPPFKIMLHNINEYHQHIDMVFFAKALENKLEIGSGESEEMKWFSEQEIKDFEKLAEDTRFLATEALRVARRGNEH